jgi:peptidoglycan hydrolase-like protein with peptidoglycan-binding domain
MAAEPAPRRNRRRVVVIAAAAAAVVVLAAGGWVARDALSGSEPASAGSAVHTSTAQVTRTDVAQRQHVNGTLSYAGAYTVLAGGGNGVVTRLPATGTTITRGHAAYEVNGDPVPLFYGTRPPWRAMSLGMTSGADVRELESNLAALGYGSGLTVDRHFTSATYWAVRHWQDDAGLPVTGAVPLGQIAVLKGALRVTGQDLKAGMPVHPGAAVVHGTSTTPIVEVQLDPTMAPSVRRRDKVLVTMPDGREQQGEVTAVSRVAVAQPSNDDQGGGGQAPQSLIPVTVGLRHAAGGLDQAQVQVAVTSEEHHDVLAVPVVALLARPDGGHQVVVVAGSARRTVAVETGLFDEASGVIEVSGAGLADGDQVEVPAQ